MERIANFRSSNLAPVTLPEAASSTVTTQRLVPAISLSAATTRRGREGQGVSSEATPGREERRKIKRKVSDQLSAQT